MLMKITIKEVAEQANVSPSTVSRVLSNSSQISEKTKWWAVLFFILSEICDQNKMSDDNLHEPEELLVYF